MTLGEKISKLRKEYNYTQEQLAEILGVSRQSISKWESNNAYPETDKLIKMGNLFECSMDYLFNEDVTEKQGIKPTAKEGFGDRKRKKILIFACVFWVVVLGVLGWRYHIEKQAVSVGDYENQFEEYELSIQAAQTQLENLQAENQELQVKNEELQNTNSSILEELKNQTMEMQELKNEIRYTYMGSTSDQFLKQLCAGQYMTAEHVPIRRMPSDNENFNSSTELSYYMVTPIAAVVNEHDEELPHWVFVSFYTIGDMADNHGWVKYSELIEYTEGTQFLLKGPFVLSEDAVDIHTGKAVNIYLRGSIVSAEFEAGYAHVVTDGGINADVDKKYLIYPEVEYNAEKTKMETAQAIFNDIYPNYIELRRLINAGSVQIGDKLKDEKGFSYFYVEEDSYQDIDDIEALMESVFSTNYIEQKLLHWVLQGESPLYKEINGKLCKLEADSPGIGASREISEILVFEENDITFAVENEGIVFKISLVKQDGNWRIDKIEETDTLW